MLHILRMMTQHLLFRLLGLHDHVVKGEISNISARVGTRCLVQGDAGVLKALKDDLEKLSLLGVHVGCLEVANAEEAVVEIADVLVVQEVTPLGHHTAGSVHAVFVVESIDVEPGSWHTALSGAPFGDELPEVCGRRGASWETTC